jgi:hypothetical protein
MTLREAAVDLLSYLSPEQRSIPCDAEADDPLPEVLLALRGALEEMGALGPLWQFRARRGARLHAPADVTVTVSEGQDTITLGAGFAWARGCSVKLPGEPWNEILDYDAGSGVATLLQSFGASASGVTARIYADCVALPDDVLKVLGPVSIADSHTLTAISNLAQWQSVTYHLWRDDDYGRSGVPVAAVRRTDDPGAPRFYFVDTHFQQGYAAAEKRLRLAPMPEQGLVLHYRARVAPGSFSIADIYDAEHPDTDPGTVIPLDDATARALFLPIARQRFTACPFFRNDNALPEIKRQYAAAYEIAKKMKPQAQGGFWIQPGA